MSKSPRKLILDSPEDACDHGDFSFAFNDSNYSDRVLRIYIFSESTQPPSVRVKTVHISSPILAARSPFFYKLLRDSAQCQAATLRINASEEASLMELLKFMYSNNLTVTTAPALLDVLMAADKFDVSICTRRFIRLLRNQKIMTPEFLLDYFDLPPTILMAKVFRPMTVFAKQFYAVHYKDISMFKDEILSLPLADVEAIIASDDLQVTSEDAVYWFVLEWARAQYPNIEERREIITTRLAKFIRFPYMTHTELMKVKDSNELDSSFSIHVVSEAICFQWNVLHPDKLKDDKAHRFVKRVYLYWPAKKTRVQERAVYLDRLARKTWVQDCFHWAWRSRQFILCFTVCFLYFTRACSKLNPAEEFVSKLKGGYAYTGSNSSVPIFVGNPLYFV
ncbi:BTB/POZ domain-containing protein POB1 isoform X2 [Helianthus annuus]|uniref:Putative SKP1/BTB/POZ domain, BTB/Kelch-associated n=1 Tax=Helianthus annuus TaxID=4232 RepID=A0A251T4M3_HELAN|nr:BTB/POZ domain-containing protein POB1 isoform X2 [Helianthus annuus]